MEVRSVEAIVKALNDAGVEYLIVGGLAVNAHGYERLTVDVDLVIGLQRENILRGLQALLAIGYRMSIPVTPEEFSRPELRDQWRRDKNMLVLHLQSDQHRRTPVDIFVHEPFDFRLEHGRAKWETLGSGAQVPIVCYETLLAMKRQAGRPKDMLDIEALGKLDPYR